MCDPQSCCPMHDMQCMHWFFIVIIILGIWDAVWKLIALWRSARNNQMAWFICIAVFNTLGILPIIYLLTHRKKEAVSGKR
jgi:hypothetical protein